jgi:hypothetical protein
MLPESAFVPAGDEVGVSAVFGTLADEVMDSIEHRSLACTTQATDCWILEEMPHERIRAKGARLVQVAE